MPGWEFNQHMPEKAKCKPLCRFTKASLFPRRHQLLNWMVTMVVETATTVRAMVTVVVVVTMTMRLIMVVVVVATMLGVVTMDGSEEDGGGDDTNDNDVNNVGNDGYDGICGGSDS